MTDPVALAHHRYERAKLILQAVTALVVVVALMVLVIVALQNHANTQLLVECTTAPAERNPPATATGNDDCYVRSEARTRAAVSQIGELSTAAAACGAANPGDVARTRNCVEEYLATTEDEGDR